MKFWRSAASATRFAFIGLALWFASRFFLRRPTAPLRCINYTTSSARDRGTLLILLPGIFNNAGDFEKRGWIDAVRERRLAGDVIAVDLHLAYYFAGNVLARLRNDVIGPAHRRGYRRIWLVGVSLGGFGALLYARAYAAEIEGVLLISPFLGTPCRTFDAAVRLARRNGQEPLWPWLSRPKCRDSTITILLAYGEEDKYAETNTRLAKMLGSERAFSLPGAHNWTTWKALWQEALAGRAFITNEGHPRFPPPGAAADTLRDARGIEGYPHNSRTFTGP